MFMLDVVTGFDCGGEDILKVIKFVWQLIDVVLFIVPMALIVMVTVDFVKNVIASKEDEMKKSQNLAIKRIIFCMALFLIDPIVSTAISLLGENGVDFMECIDIAKNGDLSKYKIDNSVNYDVPTPDFSKPSGVIPSKGESESSSDNSTSTDSGGKNSTDGNYKNIFIGDSRCVGMKAVISSQEADSTEWICEVGKGYSWLNSTAISSLDKKISTSENYNIIINLGVNDLQSISNYIKLYNSMQGNSKYKNSKIIIVSVNPIDDNLAKQHGYEPTNSQVKSFNKKLKKNLKNGIIYCDTYSQIEKNLKTSDGIHYEDSTYKKIYETILKKCL